MHAGPLCGPRYRWASFPKNGVYSEPMELIIENSRGCAIKHRRDVILRVVEIVLLIPAFGLLIPPVPSEAGHEYDLFPGLAFAVVVFVLSQSIAVFRNNICWWEAILKTLLFMSFGWLVYQRVTMCT